MRIRLRHTALLAGLGLGTLLSGVGCVERTLTIRSDPRGARVILNDEEVGISPVRVSFLWYGDYDIMLRKQGYQTLKTHFRIDPPWHQVPPIDLFSECFIIGTLHDDHILPTFPLDPAVVPPPEQVVERAAELRERALFEEG